MFKAISGFKIVIMKFGSKILGLLLIAALVTATLPTRSFAVAVADHALPKRYAIDVRYNGNWHDLNAVPANVTRNWFSRR